jgi:hypothetical protein
LAGGIKQAHVVERTDGPLDGGLARIERVVGTGVVRGKGLVRRDRTPSTAEGGPQSLFVGAEKRGRIVGNAVGVRLAAAT